jgi:uncharacterized protein involved in outer membrane biogenesis
LPRSPIKLRTKSPEPSDRRASRRALWIALGVLAATLAGVVIFLAVADWNALRGPVARYAGERLGRDVAINGDLDVDAVSLSPSATVRGLSIGQPDWAGAGRQAEIDRLYVQVRLWPLLFGRVEPLRIEADRPVIRLVRNAEGRANWDFSNGRRASKRPLRLPALQRLVITDGELSVKDAKRGLYLSARVSADETRSGGSSGFRLAGDGAVNGEPFAVALTGGPLLNNRADRPYPFTARIDAGATRLRADGTIPRPFDLGRMSAAVTARGSDLADLFPLTGVALPNTPPYDLAGRLARDGRVWSIAGLDGRVGDSDLKGDLSVDTSGERPFLKADLASRSLDFDDLAAVFGGAPSRQAGEAVSPEQAALGRRMAAQRRLLPDSKLSVTRIRAMDADVAYAAAAIRAPGLPLKAGSVRVKLDDANLVADPLRFDLTAGRVAGRVVLDAKGAVPVTTADLRLTGARLEQLIPAKGDAPPPLAGAAVGRLKLTGAGASVREAASRANGEVLIVVPGGEIREAFAELLGVNVTRGLGLLLSDDQSRTEVRCAVAHFTARDGIMSADNIVFDTGPVLGEGSGTVNLGEETLDLTLNGRPKEPRLVRLMAPVRLTGPIVAPKLGVETGGAIAQGGVAAALGALAPLAAVLPFVDLGLAEDAACGALIAEARRQGAPAPSAASAKSRR